MLFLIKLSENEKRLIIALLIAVILVFVLIGFLGLLVKKIMISQAHRADTFMYDLVVTKTVKNPRHFRRVGNKKNHRLLFKQSWLPFLFLIASVTFLLTYMGITGHWDLNVFDYYGTDGTNGEGFTTLFFVFDFANAPRTEFFGITIVSGWPPVLSSPYLSVNAWPSYVFVPLFLTGGVWYLVCVQAFIARSVRIMFQSKKVFEKRLDNYDATKNPLDNPLPPTQ
ncbi:MAG: hypothetical protein GX816_03565 [Erysipelotrichia bacterium]|mgnify:CR=1 FL=1|jgi:hypothetical protein|nr:hypothetical protein [Bacilli bacterium]MDD4005740.1 hypothetical protein [Bacilli bacterium]NMV82613.1 hypothetical protein [Erysipelotrichia bacterium]